MKKLLVLLITMLVLLTISTLQAKTIVTIPIDKSTLIYGEAGFATNTCVYIFYAGMINRDTITLINKYDTTHGGWPVYYPASVGFSFVYRGIRIKLISIKWDELIIEVLE